SFNGSLSIQAAMEVSAIALRQNGSNVVGFAAVPVSPSSMFIPAITNIQVIGTNTNAGQFTYTVTVTDYSADVATPTSTAVSASVLVVFDTVPGILGFETSNPILLDGTGMINAISGTLSGTFRSGYNRPSGSSAFLTVSIRDSLGNWSNRASV